MNSYQLLRAFSIVGLAVLPILALFWLHDLESIGGALRHFELSDLLALIAVSLSMYLLRYLRWSLILSNCGVVISSQKSIVIFLSGLALSFTPARGGELTRAYLIPNVRSRARLAFATFASEKIGDILAIILISIVAFTYASPNFRQAGVNGIERFPNASLIVAAFLIIAFATLALPRVGRYVQQVMKSTWSRDLKKSFSASVLGLSICIWLTQIAMLVLIIEQIGLRVPVSDGILIYCIALIVGAVSFIPGGLGSFDATYFLLMDFASASPDAVLISLIAIRFFGLWLGVLIGIPAWQLMSRRLVGSKRSAQ